eukprot:scpid59317/ scgid8185/ Phosphoacetylglucosamine mutase; Acetylglucosamine phosphomutase; N-acetylglucosamine-phosphate mutase; Phosphoglucomutase-3
MAEEGHSIDGLVQGYPKKDGTFEYGTAGFRKDAEVMDFIVMRMGLLAALRSKVCGGEVVGLVITASHNPVKDNGVKLVDPDGGMMAEAWEEIATHLVNVNDGDVAGAVGDIAKRFNVDDAATGCVYIGRDTRPSSDRLLQAAMQGVSGIPNVSSQDFGVVSTPHLHFLVRAHNLKQSSDYWNVIGENYQLVAKSLPISDGSAYTGDVLVDGANGVGAGCAVQLNKACGDYLNLSVINDGTRGVLNLDCGADYVKSNQREPPNHEFLPNQRCCSFDGDADRIVYFSKDGDNVFHLLDGDKIAVLIAEFIMELLEAASLHLNVGVVQTAYANGAATNVLEERKIPIACTSTGVKHLHHKAKDFEIGVYFEANGHGTVLYSDKATKMITDAKAAESETDSLGPAGQLYHYMQISNQAVGDSCADLCMVELALRKKQWSVQDWDGQCKFLPNRMLKVKVADRRVIKTTNAERQVTEPSDLQPAIDSLVAEYEQGRSFVRPSGTEDVVRVYAEANTQVTADHLAARVACAVFDNAGGSGQRPQEPSPLGAKRVKH